MRFNFILSLSEVVSNSLLALNFHTNMKNTKVCSSNFCRAYAVLIILFLCQELTTFTPQYECMFLVPVNGDISTFKVKELFILIQFAHETPGSRKGEFS